MKAKPKVKKKNGRPLTVIDWEVFDKLCEIQCTLTEIASWFDCSVDTIQRAVQSKHKVGFAVHYDQKRGKGMISIRRAQFQAAQDGNPTMLIWLGKQWLNQAEKTSVEHTGKDGGTIKTESKQTFDYAGFQRALGTARGGISVETRLPTENGN